MCRNSVAAFNMSYFGKFYMMGPDAQKAVDWIFSNNIQKPPGTFTTRNYSKRLQYSFIIIGSTCTW